MNQQKVSSIVIYLEYLNIHTKWVKDLNIKTETLNPLEDKVGRNLEDIGIGKKFMNKMQTTWEIFQRINNNQSSY